MKLIDNLRKQNLILKEIKNERYLQDKKWGEQNHIQPYWMIILMEEIGEASKEILEHKSMKKQSVQLYRQELIQCGAVIVAMIESLDRNELKRKIL